MISESLCRILEEMRRLYYKFLIKVMETLTVVLGLQLWQHFLTTLKILGPKLLNIQTAEINIQVSKFAPSGISLSSMLFPRYFEYSTEITKTDLHSLSITVLHFFLSLYFTIVCQVQIQMTWNDPMLCQNEQKRNYEGVWYGIITILLLLRFNYLRQNDTGKHY